jgi:NitT/TauT family transport system permease protein
MAFSFQRVGPNLYQNKFNWLLANLFAITLVIFGLIFFSWSTKQINAPLESLSYEKINLDFVSLITYSLRTMFRMIIAIIISVIFSVCYATLAAKNIKAEQILIPTLDILQSVPILGYISFTVAGFVALAPNKVLGVEMVAIFAIFTSQAWNITFCIYHSLKKIPAELLEAAESYRFNSWQKFWIVELPYTIPGIIWNSIVSMSGAWFFVVAAETIVYNGQKIQLPGIGSYISEALLQENFVAIAAAIFSMTLIIFLFDQLIFKPLIFWSNKFKYEANVNVAYSRSWLTSLLSDSTLIQYLTNALNKIKKLVINIPWPGSFNLYKSNTQPAKLKYLNIIWYGLLFLVCCYAFDYSDKFFLNSDITLKEVMNVFSLTLITLIRLIILLILASITFVPLGIYIGNRPRLCSIIQPMVQFLSAFPANLLFPIVVIYIVKYNLNPDIWLSPLMIIGSQWYILFNVIAGTIQIPNEFKDVMQTFKITGWQKYKKIILPGIMPHYLTGLITAAGGGWNASIIAEAVTWGDQNIYAHGVGAYIAEMTIQNDLHRVALGVIAMSCVVVILNKVFWSKLYEYVAAKFSDI